MIFFLKKSRQVFARKNPQSGMTIIEILIVIALIGTIMTIIMTNVLDRSDDANVDLVKIQAQKLTDNLGLYKLHNGRFPTTEEGLEALVKAPSSAKRWKGPYADADKLSDPWGNRFVYESAAANRYRLISPGLDQEQGTADDLIFPPEPVGGQASATIELQVPKGNLEPAPQ